MEIEKWVLIDHENQRYRLVSEEDLRSIRERLYRYAEPDQIDHLYSGVAESEFGARFRQLRESKGISVKSIAETSGLKEPNIRNIELGHRNPRFETRTKLINAVRQMLAINRK